MMHFILRSEKEIGGKFGLLYKQINLQNSFGLKLSSVFQFFHMFLLFLIKLIFVLFRFREVSISQFLEICLIPYALYMHNQCVLYILKVLNNKFTDECMHYYMYMVKNFKTKIFTLKSKLLSHMNSLPETVNSFQCFLSLADISYACA